MYHICAPGYSSSYFERELSNFREVQLKIHESSYKDFTFPIFIAVPTERFDYSEYLKIVEDILTTETKYRTG